MQCKKYFWIAKSTLILLKMLPIKFHGEISISFGKFNSLKYSLQNLKFGQNQNFESRITDRKNIFMTILIYTFKESTLLSKYIFKTIPF